MDTNSCIQVILNMCSSIAVMAGNCPVFHEHNKFSLTQFCARALNTDTYIYCCMKFVSRSMSVHNIAVESVPKLRKSGHLKVIYLP